MRAPRFTLRGLMIVVAIAAIGSFIIAQSIIYRMKLSQTYSAWDGSP